MALSRVEGVDRLFVGGLWSLRRSDALEEREITHVLSLVPFQISQLRNFKDEPFSAYGKHIAQRTVDIDDVDESDLLAELPGAVAFIHEGLTGGAGWSDGSDPAPRQAGADETDALEDGMDRMSLRRRPARGAVLVHCAAGKSRSAAVVVAYLLWRHPERFQPPESRGQPRTETARAAVQAALDAVRVTRPMAEPNDGFMEQLRMWWEMGCPDHVEEHPVYQRWCYKREVEENTAVGLAPTRLRFEDEEAGAGAGGGRAAQQGQHTEVRCKRCRKTLATSGFILPHNSSGPAPEAAEACPHLFIEPLSWMRPELEKAELNGRLLCPNAKCGAGVGRYDWKGFKCGCGEWVTPAFSLQKGRVDEVVVWREVRGAPGQGMGIRMPPGMRGQGNL